MDYVSWVGVLVAWVSVLVFVLILLVAPVALPRCFSGVALDSLLCVDALEDTTFLYCVVGLGMKLAWLLQGFVVLFLIITSTSEPLDYVDFMVIVTRSFTLEIIMVVMTPVPPFSMVAIVVMPKAAVVETSAVVSVVVSSRRLLVLLGSSDIFPDELFCIVSIGIIFGRSEELGDRGQPYVQ